MNGLDDFLEEGRSFELIEEGIYSVLDNTAQLHQYDKRAALYDYLVGTSLYNRFFWGDSPNNYIAFARAAINSQPEGPILDAGCGSLLFTAKAYLGGGRMVVACDQSLGMLRRARARLQKLNHSDNGNIILVQADLSDLPFRRNTFHTVLCMNVLHHYPDAAILVQSLKTLLSERGQLYLTSLVLNNRLAGDHYLGFLYKNSWIIQPRTAAELSRLIESTLQQSATIRTKGNMAYIYT